ncbi:MAG: NAD(P)/FAD-dependent oxidoreductase [Deltaproteobacteria bacterium]|nr:NAD(P)/FAD-dependent oxidoreductase [Deltaproteobacteria bacterium]
MSSYDAIIVGSGPNGLSAALRLQEENKRVLVLERSGDVGGGLRTDEITLPGFHHDRCASILPMAFASPYLQTLPLDDHGLEWVRRPRSFGHPLDDGEAISCERSVEETIAGLDDCDADAYRSLFGFLEKNFHDIIKDSMGPFGFPSNPLTMARFGRSAVRSAGGFAKGHFRGERARALFSGCAAHSILPFDAPLSAAIGLMLQGAAHAVGWPFPKGGAASLSGALERLFVERGGEIQCDVEVNEVQSLPTNGPILFDTSPRTLIRACGKELSSSYRRRLERFVYGPGIFKVDWALSAPIPWSDIRLLETATVHVGGTLDEIALSERAAWPTPPEKGGSDSPEIFTKPFVLLTQPSLFDDTRAPAGKHTAWAYVHVPNGDSRDRSKIIESQVERFAPGFSDVILEKKTTSAAELEAYNPNYVGGDIGGGAVSWNQLFTRPVAKISPYETDNPRIYLCSSSTPPGGGVHGMCGFYAAQAALRRWS